MLTTHLNLTHALGIRICNTCFHITLQHLSARLTTELLPWGETNQRSSLCHTITYGQWELDAAQEGLNLCVQWRTTNDNLGEFATKSIHQFLANLTQYHLIQQWHFQHPTNRSL